MRRHVDPHITVGMNHENRSARLSRPRSAIARAATFEGVGLPSIQEFLPWRFRPLVKRDEIPFGLLLREAKIHSDDLLIVLLKAFLSTRPDCRKASPTLIYDGVFPWQTVGMAFTMNAENRIVFTGL